LPKFKIDIADLEYGFPDAQPVFRNQKRKEKDMIYVTAPNCFVAENKAVEIYKKSPEKYKKKLHGTRYSAKKKTRHNI